MSSVPIAYVVAELAIAFIAAVTNALVIWVFLNRKQVRTPTNTYIFSLAITDFLAGTVGRRLKLKKTDFDNALFRCSDNSLVCCNAIADHFQLLPLRACEFVVRIIPMHLNNLFSLFFVSCVQYPPSTC